MTYLTEDQAKGKWCPHARVRGKGSEFSSCNRVPPNFLARCIGSQCMMWRGAGQQREVIRNYHDNPSVKRITAPSVSYHTYEGGWNYEVSDTDRDGRKFDILHRIAADDAPRLGFCGLAGEPVK